jgi:very-short-patch-repair endonuclease
MSERLRQLASYNGGVFTRAQALSCDYSPRQVRLYVGSGLWSVLRHGILVDAQQLSDASLQERAVLDVAAARMTLWHPSVGSHVSAGLAYGVPLPPGPHPVCLISDAPHKRGTARQPIVIRGGLLSAQHCEEMAGVLMTSPARTAADLAIVLPLQHAVAAIDALLHRQLTTVAEIVAAAEAAMTLASVMLVLAQTDSRAESALESISRVVLRLLGIEAPELQHEIRDANGKLIARVDFWWTRYRVAGEADGLLKYDADSSALRREKLRQEAIEQTGVRVVRWTWDEITKTPHVVVDRLLRAFHSPR